MQHHKILAHGLADFKHAFEAGGNYASVAWAELTLLSAGVGNAEAAADDVKETLPSTIKVRPGRQL